MRGKLIQSISILIGLLLAGCGSNEASSKPDAPAPAPPDSSIGAQPVVVQDAGCDMDAMSEHEYLINCQPGGGGTPVSRQLPVPFETCKL